MFVERTSCLEWGFLEVNTQTQCEMFSVDTGIVSMHDVVCSWWEDD